MYIQLRSTYNFGFELESENILVRFRVSCGVLLLIVSRDQCIIRLCDTHAKNRQKGDGQTHILICQRISLGAILTLGKLNVDSYCLRRSERLTAWIQLRAPSV